MPDPLFSHPRLAALYDALEGKRPDLEFYVNLIESYGAHSMLDVGCGTGALACMLARKGFDVVGLDPAEASLSIARCKPEAGRIRWILGDARAVPVLNADIAVMTGNVAQVFLSDDDWSATLNAIGGALRPEGRFVFETRDPAKEAWRNWTREKTLRRSELPGGAGAVTTWCDLTNVAWPFVSFRWTFAFEADGVVLSSDSTLRFRERTEVEQSLERNGFVVDAVLDAPDRPGLEFVFVARRVE